ncbi:hypothetical protein V8C35DRAFT_310038 [Trichoderma chlorosporum]
MSSHPGSKYDMIMRLRVADYLTLANALCGVLSVFFSIHQNYIIASVLIHIGYEFDVYDGRVARWRNECSELGKELDSLSDIVTFGIAPVVMVYSVGFQSPLDQLALVFYVLCGVARLARFNVTAHLIARNKRGEMIYEGLPIPFAASVVSATAAICVWMDWIDHYVFPAAIFPETICEFHLGMVLVIALGAMMASRRLRLTGGGVFGVLNVIYRLLLH